MFRMIARGIEVQMSVGICDWERQRTQKVVVNATVFGHVPLDPSALDDCLDYSRLCEFVHGWADQGHVDLVETLLFDAMMFCFEDPRVFEVDIEIIKPQVIPGAAEVGVGARLSRAQFESAQK